MEARTYSLLLLVLMASLIPGCDVYETPDGHRFSSLNGTGRVEAVLGKPDFVREREKYYFGPYRGTAYIYMDRGYEVGFVNGSVSGISLISEDRLLDHQRRKVALRDEVPKVPPGASGSDVVAAVGPPDYVWAGQYKDGAMQMAYEGPYRGQLETNSPAPETYAFWKKRYLYVSLRDGRVTGVRPLTLNDWTIYLHEAPPGRD